MVWPAARQRSGLACPRAAGWSRQWCHQAAWARAPGRHRRQTSGPALHVRPTLEGLGQAQAAPQRDLRGHRLVARRRPGPTRSISRVPAATDGGGPPAACTWVCAVISAPRCTPRSPSACARHVGASSPLTPASASPSTSTAPRTGRFVTPSSATSRSQHRARSASLPTTRAADAARVVW